MKTFREFVFITEDKMGQRLGNMSDADFEQFLKGRTPGESETYRQKRAQFRKTTVSGQDVRGSRSTQTPPRQPSGSTQTQTPPRQSRSAQSTQTPPRGTQASSRSTPPPRNTQRPSSSTPPRTSAGQLSPAVQRPTATTPQTSSLRSRVGKLIGPVASVGGGALDYKERRSQGQSRTQAATGALATTAGSEAGWRAGARGGAALGSRLAGPRGALIGGVVGGIGGSILGGEGAGKLSDKLTGGRKAPTEKDYEKARQRYGVTQSRKVAAQSGTYGARQGSALTGVGGPTTVNRKSGTLTSGGKTAKLASTQLVRDPKTGQQRVGDLAYRGGQAVYLARPSVASRDTGLGGIIRNVSRTTGIGGQRQRDAAAAKAEYRTALKNTQQYQRQLGVTPKAATAQKLPGRGVGPKKVGAKIVGPKKVGPKIVGTKK